MSLRQLLERPLCPVARGFLLFGLSLCVSVLAALLTLNGSDASEAAEWVSLHFREGVSVVLFSFDLAVGLFLLCQRLDGADEMTDPDA